MLKEVPVDFWNFKAAANRAGYVAGYLNQNTRFYLYI